MIEEGSTAVANLIEGVRRPAQSTRNYSSSIGRLRNLCKRGLPMILL